MAAFLPIQKRFQEVIFPDQRQRQIEPRQVNPYHNDLKAMKWQEPPKYSDTAYKGQNSIIFPEICQIQDSDQDTLFREAALK